MSCSSAESSPASQPEVEADDPLCITEDDRKQFKETEASKRKSVSPDSSDSSAKKQKTDENGTAKVREPEVEPDGSDEEKKETDEQSPAPEIKEVEETDKGASPSAKEDFDIAEKLKTMDEISIKPVSATEKEQTDIQNEELDDKVSIEITKKEKTTDRKVTNLRKNIKDVIDDTHLDETTLAAQRQESERLARVQEQQRLIRETQRQIVAEKQANKTQQRVLSILQGEPSDLPCSSLNLDDPLLEKFSLSSAVSITPAAKAALQSIQSLISTDDQIPESDLEDDSDDDVMIQPDESMDKSKAVVVDSSSDDDCIILSDEDEEDADSDDENNSGEHTNDHYNQRDAEGRVVVNIGHNDKEQNIYVAPQIARVIKPHQIGGVRFLFDNIIESTELFSKSTGFGCILAHSMGLGKTLQLVCFCDIFLRHTNSKNILIIMPINTLQNWLHEFNMWLPLPEDVEKSPLTKDGEVRPRQFNIYVLNDSQKSLSARAKTVLEWSKEGGVLMMGYEMYRLLSLKKIKPKRKRGSYLNTEGEEPHEHKKLFDDINAALVNPGPDLVVCDEGHRIKNAHASTSLALKQIKSKRRIVLTGYPLQNNLLEYWCMVDFVRPSYLGTKTEFSNMFERPIQNGQCVDSTPSDCKLMRHRAYVLHSLLKGFVQRRSHTVLQKSLPEKTEFVLLVRMTPFQRKLYSVFMDEVVRSKKVPNPLKAFSVCCKIWNHPDVLYNFLKKRELDLDIELEDTETIIKNEVPGPKKRGRKAKGSGKDVKSEKKDVEPEQSPIKTELAPVRLEPMTSSSTSDNFKPSMTVSSNDSAYSSSQSTNASYDSTSGSYNAYTNYETSSYQNYSYNNGNSYQNWNGSGNNYWQNNQGYGYGSEYNQGYYQHQNSYQQPSYYGNSTNYQSFDQKPPMVPKVEPNDVKSGVDSKPLMNPSDGGLLADVIKEETKELRDKDFNEAKVKSEAKDCLIVSKSSRDDGIPYDWAGDLMKEYVSDMLENSPKMELFFCILEESVKLGDRLLVFSQSLLTLNLMERFLTRSKIPDTDTCWAKNTSYFRLDGSTAALEREKLINEFNSNNKVKLFLVSTRAGSLGINLVGANRVVVFDASWNPCHDTQAVCRVYRYGQAKSCYVYRFVMDNCLEKKIYDRQINKQGMADRVVDECNPDANLSMREVTSLCYDDGEDPEVEDFSGEVEKFSDLVAKKMLQLHSKSLTKMPFSHESLLIDRKEKQLTVAEKRLAKRGYEMEKQAASKPTFNYNTPGIGSNYRAYRTTDGSLIHRPVASVRPMQSELGDALNTVQHPNPRPNRWVPVETWQAKGLHAQEMTLPQDVSIQTNSADKSKIYLKAGQKVIVLKSAKGICLQLESGKVIAIRASVKSGQQAPNNVEQKLGSFPSMPDAAQNSGFRPNFPPQNSGDVIDISNDDDEEDKPLPTNPKPIELPPAANVPPLNMMESMNRLPPTKPIDTTPDSVYKEKVVYKPNLVSRKPKMPPPPVPSQDVHPLKPSYESGYRSQQRPPSKWDTMKSFPPSTSNYNPRNLNGAQKSHSSSYQTPTLDVRKPEEIQRDPPIDSSAFHPPSSAPPPVNSYVPPPYSQPPAYDNPVYPNPSYPTTPAAENYNYSYHQPSYPNSQPNHYAPQVPNSFNQGYAPYQQGYNSINYNQIPPPHSYPPPINPDPSVPAPYTAPASNYGQWNYNN